MSITDQLQTDGDFTGAIGGLVIAVGSLRDTIRKDQQQREEIAAKLAGSPSYIDFAGTGLVDANGVAVIGMGELTPDAGPSSGYLWHIRKLKIGKNNPATNLNGTADVFIVAGGYKPNSVLADGLMSQWEDHSASLPALGTYGDGEIVLKGTGQDKLLIIVTGGTAGDVITVAGRAKNVQEVTIPPGGNY